MAKSKKTSDAFDMADDIRKEVAAESVADACSTSVPAIYSLAKGDNPRRAKYDKNADVIGYNLRLPANIHRLLKRHCMETIYESCFSPVTEKRERVNCSTLFACWFHSF